MTEQPRSSQMSKQKGKKEKKFTKQEISWMFYDWANSIYATNIMAAIFPIYFSAVCSNGDSMWGFGTSIATFVVAISAPFLGAIGDYKGMKKRLLIFFMCLGTSFTLLMAIADNWRLMLVGYVISYIGFLGGNLFYDSFLTDVTTKEKMDKVSSYGYAMGYFGGSTLPFIISIGIMTILGFDNPLGVKIAVVLTAVWWAVFSIPIIRNVHQVHYQEIPPKHFIGLTLKSVGNTFSAIFKRKSIFIFVLAYFFYIDGVDTVINMATAYGSKIGLDTVGMILALLVTQIVAVPFSILFSVLSKKFGSIRMISFAVSMYIFICIVGYYMGASIESAPKELFAHTSHFLSSAETSHVHSTISASLDHAKAIDFSERLFWIMALLVGTVQGGIQAISRSYYGKIIPKERSNEFFGFFDIFGKFAAIIGPFLYATITTLTNSSAKGILSVSVLFAIALVVLLVGRKQLAVIQEVS